MPAPNAEVIGVYGGSFDPPHVGHVLLPTLLMSQGLVDRLVVAPAASHPLKSEMSPFEDRLAWTIAAMRVHGSRVEVTDIEEKLLRDHDPPIYTLHLLEAVAAAHPQARVRLVIGSDIIAKAEYTKWHRWEEIERRFEPVVVPRAGHARKEICFLPEVSSSQIRSSLRRSAWDELATLVAPQVLAMLRAGASQNRSHVLLVGRGHVATRARTWLATRGQQVTSVGGHDVIGEGWKTPVLAHGAWVLVRDQALPQVAQSLARPGALPPGIPVLSAAGALRAADPRALATLREAGHPVGTLHPICSLRSEVTHDVLSVCTFGVEGDPEAVAFANSLLGDQPAISLQGLDAQQRTAYHAACALAANHLGVLLGAAQSVLEQLGAPGDVARPALETLMRSALDNLIALGPVQGLTGPVARGDLETVRAHVEALPAGVAELYEQLSDRLREIMAARNASS